jgi:membrane-bound lytic murein transglycosylase B
MRMLDAGYTTLGQFKGSWAGAFGNMQFMPTTFMTYALDGDGDKVIDIAHSLADSFASAANYLSQVGWVKGEPVMIEVYLPANFVWQNAQINVRKPVSEWVRLGVTDISGNDLVPNRKCQLTQSTDEKISKKMHSDLVYSESSLTKVSHAKSKYSHGKNNKVAKKSSKFISKSKVIPLVNQDLVITALPSPNAQAAIVLPQGWSGPAFMVFDNFDAVMDWNRSINYAISVAQLAKSINGEAPIVGGKLAELGALSYKQMYTLQVALKHLGFELGEPDGFPGVQTQAAIRAYQLTQNIPADGYASSYLLNRLLSD